jgi:hypothetical protein
MAQLRIPKKYAACFLKAMAAYPELDDVNIRVILSRNYPSPYGTLPVWLSIFRSRKNRAYKILLLEEADEPVRSILFKNLSEEKQTAIIAHELMHVKQFHACSPGKLLLLLAMYYLPAVKRKLERAADIEAIKRGFGQGLYDHAVFMRSFPEYIKTRPEIDKYYLTPEEILSYLTQLKH